METETVSKLIRYSGKLLRIKPGQLLIVSGRVKNEAKEFLVSFGSDRDDNGNIQLGMRIKFGDDPEIIRNSFSTEHGWSTEEITQNLLTSEGVKNPIRSGNDFKLAFLTDEEKFLITIDGKTFCTFRYRHPLSDIKRINVYGDVEEIYQVEHQILAKTSEKPNNGEFIGSIPTIKAGMAIVLHGVFKGQNGESFCLKLTDSGNSENVVTLYWVCEDGVWNFKWRIDGNISLSGPCPLVGGEDFPYDLENLTKVAVGITKTNFYVTANGKHFIASPHDGNFLNKPLSYHLSAESLNIQEINIHHLNELEELRKEKEENDGAKDVKPVFGATVDRENVLKQIVQN